MYRHHSSRYADADIPWLVSSGFEGVKEMTLLLKAPSSVTENGQGEKEKEANTSPPVDSPAAPAEKQRYDVELIFALPKSSTSSESVFDVSVDGCDQSEHVELKSTDGSATLVKRSLFHNVLVGESLKIQIKATAGVPSVSGIRLRKINE